jgi:hypothetical protein
VIDADRDCAKVRVCERLVIDSRLVQRRSSTPGTPSGPARRPPVDLIERSPHNISVAGLKRRHSRMLANIP